MTIRIVAIAAAAFACLSPVAHAETREPVSAVVSYVGLDLSTVEGRRMLDARIDTAARRACVSRSIGLRALSDVRRCRAEMRNDAQVRLAQIMPRVRVASVR